MTSPRFSPIDDQAQLLEALEFVSSEFRRLTQLLTGLELPVPIVKVFAHYPGEFDGIRSMVATHGPVSNATSDMSFYVEVESGLVVMGDRIELLGVRRADPYRSQVGCADSYLDDFEGKAMDILQAQPEFARSIESEHGLSMVELWHPDYDVLGYLIPEDRQ